MFNVIGRCGPPALQTVQGESGTKSVAQVELLADADVCSGTHEQADGPCGSFTLVCAPGAREIKSSAQLVVPDSVRRNRRVLIQKCICGT